MRFHYDRIVVTISYIFANILSIYSLEEFSLLNVSDPFYRMNKRLHHKKKFSHRNLKKAKDRGLLFKEKLHSSKEIFRNFNQAYLMLRIV